MRCNKKGWGSALFNAKFNLGMKQILLLDSTNNIIREFDTYKQANQFRMMNNRPDWSIASRKLFWNGSQKYYA